MKRLFFFALLFSSVSVSVFAQDRDYWLQYQRKGMAYAYEHLVRFQTETGYRYIVEHKIKMDVVGLNPQEITLHGEYWVDFRFKPLSFKIDFKSILREVHLKGQYQEGKLIVSITEKEGETQQKEFSAQETYFDCTLADLMLQRKAEKSFHVNLFSPIELRSDTVQIHLENITDQEIQATVKSTLTLQYTIDLQGKIQKASIIEMNTQMLLVDADTAKKIDYLKTDDGFTLTVKSKKGFPNVYLVEYAQLLMEWKDIPLEAFCFEDNRQKMIKTEKTATGTQQVWLEVKTPSLTPKSLTVPIQEESLALYLQETFYIKPNDPNIQQQLTEIQGQETDAFRLVEKILDWIDAHIQAELIAETLNGPEVLKMKRGKCSEYAILFASFTRSAGIPTKIVLGERNFGDQWMGHMWNEVWIGEWLTVDPSQSAFITDPSLLKFVDSDTVEGTQHVRMKLIDNLSLEILEFREKKQTPTAIDLKTGVVGTTYTNQSFRCRLIAPSEQWEFQEEVSFGHTVITLKHKEQKDILIALVLMGKPGLLTMPHLLEIRLQAISAKVKQFQKLFEEETFVAGEKAIRAQFQHEKKPNEIVINENILFSKGSSAYLFAYIAPTEQFEAFRAEFQKILDQFELY